MRLIVYQASKDADGPLVQMLDEVSPWRPGADGISMIQSRGALNQGP